MRILPSQGSADENNPTKVKITLERGSVANWQNLDFWEKLLYRLLRFFDVLNCVYHGWTNKFEFDYPQEVIDKHQAYTEAIQNIASHLISPAAGQPPLGEPSSTQELEANAIKTLEQLQEVTRKVFQSKHKNFNDKIKRLASQNCLFIIESDDSNLRKIFFHYLEVLDSPSLRKSGIIHRVKKEKTRNSFPNHSIIKSNNETINVLLVFGKCQDPDLEIKEDIKLWKKFAKNRDINIIGTLQQPTYEHLQEAFCNKKVDILYYKSHEETGDNSDEHRFCINNQDSITVNDICRVIQEVKSNKIKLMMLMSCNSQEMAETIITEEHNCVEQIIASRELLNDHVITTFLKEFLDILRDEGNQNPPLPIASIVRRAKNRVSDPTNIHKLTAPAIAMYQSSDVSPLVWNEPMRITFIPVIPWLNPKYIKYIFLMAFSVILALFLHFNPLAREGNPFSRKLVNHAIQSTVSIEFPDQKDFYSGIIIAKINNSEDKSNKIPSFTYYVLTTNKIDKNLSDAHLQNGIKKSILVDKKSENEDKYDMIIEKKSILDGITLASFKSQKELDFLPLIYNKNNHHNDDILITSFQVFEKPWKRLEVTTNSTRIETIHNIGYDDLEYNLDYVRGGLGSPIINPHGCVIGIHHKDNQRENPYTGTLETKEQSDRGISLSVKELEKVFQNEDMKDLFHLIDKISKNSRDICSSD